ncbi:MAG TPA: RluA family pseudouridine synthase [Saprospiraceae bacterium]|nr:RluA family pseudouridine synthase [Saprospiraceae bacterium]HMQ84370.1 RluA family pseudouridine synthase [Saprospiraceae bacterium]
MSGLEVLFEDNHLIAVNKPAGILVQGDETEDRPLGEYVKDYIKHRYQKPGDVFLGVIHRLDRPVSGVCVFARTSKALSRMNELFKNRDIQKTYWAITNQRPEPLSGHLIHYIEKDKNKNLAHAYLRQRNQAAKQSELDYKLIGSLGSHHLLEVKPLTGRPHQIRAQLAKIGCPIMGDVKYGHKQANRNGAIHLHCRNLSFLHPVKKEMVSITASLPRDQIWSLFDEG